MDGDMEPSDAETLSISRPALMWASRSSAIRRARIPWLSWAKRGGCTTSGTSTRELGIGKAWRLALIAFSALRMSSTLALRYAGL